MPFEPGQSRWRPEPLQPPPPRPKPPPPPVPPKHCRYHATLRATCAVYAPSDWVLLCTACGRAVRDRGLVVLDQHGAFSGFVPPVTMSK